VNARNDKPSKSLGPPPELDFDNEKYYSDDELAAVYNWEFLREVARMEPQGREIIHPFTPFADRFPDSPYLTLPDQLKQQLENRGPAAWFRFTVPESLIQADNLELMPHSWSDAAAVNAAHEFLILAIDWNLSPKVLKNRFAEIVKARRPRSGVERRGRTTVREVLKFLAAKRIWKSKRDLDQLRRKTKLVRRNSEGRKRNFGVQQPAAAASSLKVSFLDHLRRFRP
jgi:hypothetical protein